MTTESPRFLHKTLDEFKEEVKKAKGRVVVLVHPYFNQYASSDYYEALQKIQSKSRVPIIVLQEVYAVPKAGFMAPANPFYVITHPKNPEPVHGWEALHRALQNNGVKTILLGGMYAQIEPHFEVGGSIRRYEKQHLPRPTKHTINVGCVGATYRRLVEYHPDLKIRLIPGLLAPEKPHNREEETI